MKMLDLTLILIIIFLVKKILDKKYCEFRYVKVFTYLLYLYPLILCIKSRVALGVFIYLIFLIIYSYFKISLLERFHGHKQFKINWMFDFMLLASTIIVFECFVRSHYLSIKPFYIDSKTLRILLAILLVTSPSNQLFRIMFSSFQTQREKTKAEEAGAGAIIGSLERMLCLFFLSMQEVGAVGLVYTAKSVARFKQIEEDKNFAEYYLIGSLYSILAALVIFHIISYI